MAYILKRPLFRKGGLSQTARPTYQGGGVTAIRPRYRGGGLGGIMSGIVPRRGYQFGAGDALGGGSWATVPDTGPEWHEDIYISPITGTLQRGEKEQYISPARPHRDIIPPPQEQPKIEIKTAEKTPSDLETIKSYMSMFQEALGEDQEDITRDKYLQLAQFGASLLAQPGGDLTGAIGKAAGPTIEGLGKIEARKRQADREIKLAAIKTAIEKMDDPTLKKMKTIAKAAGMDLKDVAKSFVPEDGKTKESIITTNQDAMAKTIGDAPALKAARTMYEAGLDFALFSELPVDKEGEIKPDTPNGYYYDEKGNLSIVKDGKKSAIKFKAKE